MLQRINLRDYPVKFQQASQSLSHKHYKLAEQQFYSCLQANPSSYSSLINLASIAYINGQLIRAIQICDVAIAMQPFCGEGYYNRCIAVVGQGDKFYKQAYADILAALSCLYLQQFKLKGKYESLQKSVQLAHNNIESLRFLMILSKGQVKEKIQKLLVIHQKTYSFGGSFSSFKNPPANYQPLYRLQSILKFLSIQDLKTRISEYQSLLKSSKWKSMPSDIQNENNIKFVSKVYQISIEPTVSWPQIESQHSPSDIQIQQQQLIPFTYEKIQIIQSLKPIALQNKLNHTLNVHQTSSITNSLNSFLTPHKSTNKICNTSFSSCKSNHLSCSKCTKNHEMYESISYDAVKMTIKTLQIFRNQNLHDLKTYLIVFDGSGKLMSQVDYTNNHFPKWDKIFYLQKENFELCRIELWTKNSKKQKSDILIGQLSFIPKLGRSKHFFLDKNASNKKTAYVFINISQ